MDIQEEIARAVNKAGWTCDGGSDEPGNYGESPPLSCRW